MTHLLSAPWLLLLAVPPQVLIVAQSARLFIQYATKNHIPMTDILFLLASIGFFALMIVFIWACEKV